MSVTRGKSCMESAEENEESEHFKRHRGFPDMEYDGKKSMTAIGKLDFAVKNRTISACPISLDEVLLLINFSFSL